MKYNTVLIVLPVNSFVKQNSIYICMKSRKHKKLGRCFLQVIDKV